MKRLITRLGLAITVAASVLGAGASAQAAPDSGYEKGPVFAWHLGDDFIAALGLPTDSQAKADNGDVITIKGTGAFSLHPKVVSGGGTFVHHVAATGEDLTGTYHAKKLISFENYGNGVPQGLPENFFGGKLVIGVTLTPDIAPWKHFHGTLTIYCTLGTVPPGVVEGATLNVKDLIDFDEIVHHSGANVYVKLA